MTDAVAMRVRDAVRAATVARTAESVGAALRAVSPAELTSFFHVELDASDAEPIGTGLPASPGAASGEIVLSADAAVAAADEGRDVILVRGETTPEDVVGMQMAKGILTTRGGMVSHAAVVARGWGIPAVVGATDVRIDGDTVRIGSTSLRAGDVITIDGATGSVYPGALATRGTEPPAELDVLLGWADAVNAGHVQVRVNADTAGDAGHGRSLGAQGIGLCRTEHMFLAADRLPAMQRFILADDEAAEEAALAELEEAQEADFEALLRAMGSLPVTIRLLDPPLHEFLPDLVDLVVKASRGEATEDERVQLAAVRRLHESNPMIGTRGVRVGVIRPGVYEMQVRALCRAAATLFEQGDRPRVEIMIPLVVDAEELRIARGWVTTVLDELGHPELSSTIVTVGAMVETPRAALIAGSLAAHADFFSFGTNDLTQMTYAFSRDDVEARLLPAYQALGVLSANPFAVLDQDGVGELLRIACAGARAAKPSIKLGACGEHAGDPDSAAFLVRLGVDSVSCSPFRVPMARLGVAQALLDCARASIDDIEFSFPDADGPAETDSESPRSDTGTHDDIDEAWVLHTLKTRGFITPDGFVASLGSFPAAIVADLTERGLVRHVETRDMYALLPPGQERHAETVAAVRADVHQALAPVYERFLPLNDDLKALCSRWQMRSDDEPNDHTDAAYDAECIEQLGALADTAGRLVDEFAAVLPRMARYNGRLLGAAAAVAEGDHARFTGVLCESFHDVWMELHQDLVLLLDIDRVEEGSF